MIALQTAKAQLDRVEEELSKAQVKAPADGVIVLEQDSEGRGTQQRELQPGDRVWEGRTVATIADLSQMRVEIELDAGPARQVKRKQRAIVTADAMPRSAFEGEVSEISQTANESTLPGTGMPSGERTFQAKVAIKDLKKAKLRPGMTAQVRIITETIKSAVRVPLECVFEKDERRVVYVKQGGGFREVEVELGPQSSDMVVVEKGLSGSERVSLRDVGRASAQGGMDGSAPPRPPATPVGAGR